MSTVGYGTLEVIPSVKGMRRDLERQTSGDLAAAGRTGGKKFGDAAGKEAATGFRSRFSGAMRGFAPLAGLVGGASLIAGFKSAIDGASDLAESTSKAQVVFGEASDSVLKFGEDASKSLGQSEAQALSAAGTFGNLLRSVGLSEEVAAQFSTTMVGLASDLASFNNTSVDDALEALRAGLVGETEPLKKFGVNMNEAVLKAKAFELGLSDGKAVLDSNAKAQAAYAVIMEQTTLAQGDFARTSDGLANQQKTLGAQWEEMTTALGKELLPATTEFVSFLNDKGLPALGEAGGLAKDAVSAFTSLPPPILGAAAAFGALRLASSSGVTAGLQSGVTATGSAMEGLRIRTMLAADTWQLYRTNVAGATLANGTVIASNGRVAASMAAVSAATAGAGTAMRAGLSKSLALVGGPWGAAMIGGTALLTKFWSEHQEAKQHVEDLTASLDAQTGALTENSREKIYAALADEGVIAAARRVGLNLRDVQQAAEGNAEAQRRLNNAYEDFQREAAGARDATGGLPHELSVQSVAWVQLNKAIDGQNDAVAKSRQEWNNKAEALDRGTEATDKASGAMRTYGTRVDGARTALSKLIEKEGERALAAIQNRRDSIALKETLAAAREEMRDGKRTLDENTEAGRENMKALLDLGDQWSTSTEKVQNAKGAYRDMRRDFIRVAMQMDATKGEAIKLADQVLKVPKTADIKFQSKGYRERLEEIKRLKSEMEQMTGTLIFNGDGKAVRVFANGGKVGGTGTGDNQLILADPREWVMNPRAVNYYGDGFMNALNKMQLPRFASGGPVSGAPAPSPAPAAAGVQVNIGTVMAQDYRDLMQQLQRRAQMAQSDGVRMGVPR